MLLPYSALQSNQGYAEMQNILALGKKKDASLCSVYISSLNLFQIQLTNIKMMFPLSFQSYFLLNKHVT